MEICEIRLCTLGTIERDEIRLQLDEVAGDETSGDPQIAQDLDEEPARVAARPRALPSVSSGDQTPVSILTMYEISRWMRALMSTM